MDHTDPTPSALLLDLMPETAAEEQAIQDVERQFQRERRRALRRIHPTQRRALLRIEPEMGVVDRAAVLDLAMSRRWTERAVAAMYLDHVPGSGVDLLRTLATDSRWQVRAGCASSTGVLLDAPDVERALWQDSDERVWLRLVGALALGIATCEDDATLMRIYDTWRDREAGEPVLIALATNLYAPVQVLMDLVAHPDDVVRAAAAQSGAMTGWADMEMPNHRLFDED